MARQHYLRVRNAAVSTQCAWRGKVARRELRKLKLVRLLFYFTSLFWSRIPVLLFILLKIYDGQLPDSFS